MICTCSIDAADESMTGTAPASRNWLLVEDPGPWSAHAVDDAPIPEASRDWIAAQRELGYRPYLIRRHTRSAREWELALAQGTARREVFACDIDAHAAGDPWAYRRATIGSLERLADLGSLGAPATQGWVPHTGALVLTCTNGKRDECCARTGRPVAAATAARWPDESWEVTHIGGHRFAATMMTLPFGHALGRLDPDAALAQVARVLQGLPPEDGYYRSPKP